MRESAGFQDEAEAEGRLQHAYLLELNLCLRPPLVSTGVSLRLIIRTAAH